MALPWDLWALSAKPGSPAPGPGRERRRGRGSFCGATDSGAVRQAGSHGHLCTLTPLPGSSAASLPREPSPRPSETAGPKGEACTDRQKVLGDSHLAAWMKTRTSRPGVSGGDPGGAPGDHALQLPSRGEAQGLLGRPDPLPQAASAHVCAEPRAEQDQQEGGRGPEAVWEEELPQGDPFPWLDARRGGGARRFSLYKGRPSNSQSCCFLQLEGLK